MTFCLGIKVKDGLVGLADTRVTSGTEVTTARKVTVHQHGDQSFFLMTSGLRSVRDKALTYFEETLDESEARFDRLYKAVNALAEQTRRVEAEDREALELANLPFNLHALVGGQLSRDREHRLYLLYPQGNWVEVGEGSPYCIIGETGYGKPILDRVLQYDDPVSFALKVACLAFDSTRISASNVDFPLDVVLYASDTYEMIEHRFEKSDLATATGWWQSRLRSAVDELPSEWQTPLLSRVRHSAQGSDTIRLPQAEAPGA